MAFETLINILKKSNYLSSVTIQLNEQTRLGYNNTPSLSTDTSKVIEELSKLPELSFLSLEGGTKLQFVNGFEKLTHLELVNCIETLHVAGLYQLKSLQVYDFISSRKHLENSKIDKHSHRYGFRRNRLMYRNFSSADSSDSSSSEEDSDFSEYESSEDDTEADKWLYDQTNNKLKYPPLKCDSFSSRKIMRKLHHEPHMHFSLLPSLSYLGLSGNIRHYTTIQIRNIPKLTIVTLEPKQLRFDPIYHIAFLDRIPDQIHRDIHVWSVTRVRTRPFAFRRGV